MGENTDSFGPMRKVGYERLRTWEPHDKPQIGDFAIWVATKEHVLDDTYYGGVEGQRYIGMMLPSGIMCIIPIRPLVDQSINGGHSWEWDGNEEAPTLTPSVHHVGIWHGFITAGRMVSC